MACLLHIEYDDLELYERCGSGTYGSVYRSFWKSAGTEVAVKKLLTLGKEVLFRMLYTLGKELLFKIIFTFGKEVLLRIIFNLVTGLSL